jgi:type III restriction enzyme
MEVTMGVAAKKISTHPYIVRQKGICGGRSVIKGTRIPVWSLIKWYKLGMPVEEVIREFPQLAPAQVHDAFSFYYDNPDEIEQGIADNEDEHSLRAAMK